MHSWRNGYFAIDLKQKICLDQDEEISSSIYISPSFAKQAISR